MAVHFITGATGLVGGRLIRDLREQGHEVRALVRLVSQGPAIAALGAEVVVGDLTSPAPWIGRLDDAEVIWHAGLPRFSPPIRAISVRRGASQAARAASVLAEAAGDRPVILASSALVYGSHAGMPVGEDDPVRPSGMAMVAAAAEDALAPAPGLRIVRLGWVYGPSGMIASIVRGLQGIRYRVVGDGTNHMPLISASDAAAAMLAAAALPPGAHAAAEADVPTQRELVHAICAEIGALRPDHLPPRVAALSFGGALVEGLRTSIALRPGRLAEAGWTPAQDWRRDLVSSVRTPADSGPA